MSLRQVTPTRLAVSRGPSNPSEHIPKKMNESAALNASDVNSAEVERVNVEKYLVPVVFGLIFVVGAVGNGSLMFIICRYKSMRNLPNLFVFNLALGDLFILLFAVPFTSSIYTFNLWPFGELVCKASEFAKDTSVSVSVFTLTALSFDRYNVIVNPVQSYVAAGPKLKRRIIFTLAAIWLASLGLASPAAVFSRLVEVKLLPTWNSSTLVFYDVNNDDQLLNQTQNENETSSAQLLFRFCYPFPGKFGVDIHSKAVIVGRVLIQYLIPLAIIGTFYTITARNLLRNTGNIDGEATVTAASTRPNLPPSTTSPTNNNTNSNQEIRRKVARMVQSLVALFLICFLPIHIYFLWFYFNPNSQEDYNQYWHSFRIVGFVFAYTNSCINPVALYFISTNFRKHFDRLLFCCCLDGRSISVRRDDDDPLNEFHHQRGLNPLTSLEQTPASDKRTTSTQNASDVSQTAVSSVHDETSGNNKPLPVNLFATINKENVDALTSIDPALSIV